MNSKFFSSCGWSVKKLHSKEVIKNALILISKIYDFQGDLKELDNHIVNLYRTNPERAGEYYDKLNNSKGIMILFKDKIKFKSLLNLYNFHGHEIQIKFTNFQCLVMLPNKSNENLGWHQDSKYFSKDLKTKYSGVIWTPFCTNNLKSKFNLDILENSHISGGIKHKKNKSMFRKEVINEKKGRYFIDNEKKLNFYSKLSPSVNWGESLIINSNLIHKSSNDFSENIRFTAIWRYEIIY
tara:strand:+ start:477 stop:1193 length:717 start_codon:yes stop_codon:yes gene_type:complete